MKTVKFSKKQLRIICAVVAVAIVVPTLIGIVYMFAGV